MTHALLIPVDDVPRPVDVDDLHGLQRLVEGSIDVASWVFGAGSGIIVYLNDTGKFTQPPNRAVFADREGTRWDGTPIHAGDLLDILHGPIVCIGDDGEGGDADLTDEQVEAVMSRFGEDTIGSGMLAAMGVRLVATYPE